MQLSCLVLTFFSTKLGVNVEEAAAKLWEPGAEAATSAPAYSDQA